MPAPARGGDEARWSADLRMPALGLAAWLSALAALYGPGWPTFAVPLVALVLMGWRCRRGRSTLLAVLVVAGGTAGVANLHVARLGHGPVPELADQRSRVQAELVVASDPRRIDGQYAEMVLVRGTLRSVSARGRRWTLRAPVVVLADPTWSRVELGATVEVNGRLEPADGDAAALLLARGSPQLRDAPDLWWRGAASVRASLRQSVSTRPEEHRALVPALVVGDESRISADLADDFRTTGLTHLLAVSGTNLTLMVGFLLVVSRWCGVRGRWLYLVGGIGIVGFVLLARTEPSVVRAATMGTVALLGMGRNGLQRGTRGLGVAVVCLLLVDPWLAVRPGFALSVLATAGILLLAPMWRDAMARWMPRWWAEAISVPAAAQLACTPVVAAISSQVSLVAVVANLLAAPVVGPATVLGLAGGLIGVAWPWLSSLIGACAGWCVAWLVLIARRGAELPAAAITWDPGAVSIGVLSTLCLALALLAPRILRRRLGGVAIAIAMVMSVTVRAPTPTWPGEDWVIAACSVGQGDALVLRAGHRQGVVIDAGPDVDLVDECLRRLGIRAVPLIVISHFHADHVDGLAGVLRDRSAGQVLVSPVGAPVESAEAVTKSLADLGVPMRVPAVGERLNVGEVSLEVLGPAATLTSRARFGDLDSSAVNNASLVVLAEVRGLRVLLSGDIEPEAQAVLERSHPGLRADVLKVPHHGSRHQDLEFLRGLRARLALVSVGQRNDYGHPADSTLQPLEDTGAHVLRTDLGGDLLVMEDSGRMTVRTQE